MIPLLIAEFLPWATHLLEFTELSAYECRLQARSRVSGVPGTVGEDLVTIFHAPSNPRHTKAGTMENEDIDASRKQEGTFMHDIEKKDDGDHDVGVQK